MDLLAILVVIFNFFGVGWLSCWLFNVCDQPTTSTILTTIAAKCSEGFYGKYCDECGISYFGHNARIVGGQDALAHSWPSAVYFEQEYSGLFYIKELAKYVNVSEIFSCGGTLIDRETIMTAAHCIRLNGTYEENNKTYYFEISNADYPSVETTLSVLIGLHSFAVSDGTTIVSKVRKVFVHEKFDYEAAFNDIALLKLEAEVSLNQYIQISCLPPKKSADYPPPTPNSYVVGWGTLRNGSSPDILQNVKLNIYDDSICTDLADTPKNFTLQLCAGDLNGGKDTCEGDSGGSLFVKDTIGGKAKWISAGIVSYGDGCGKYPGIYTRVSSYLDWIEGKRGL